MNFKKDDIVILKRDFMFKAGFNLGFIIRKGMMGKVLIEEEQENKNHYYSPPTIEFSYHEGISCFIQVNPDDLEIISKSEIKE